MQPKESNPTNSDVFPFSTPQPKPKKQGLIYSIDVGQNNGPFLLKDINLQNSKSIRFLKSAEMKRVASQASNAMEGPYNSKIELSAANRVFEDWEGLIEAKLGIKRAAIFKLTDPSKEDIENLSQTPAEENDEGKPAKEKEYMDLENVEEKHRTKLSNIENLTNEINFQTETLSRLRKDSAWLKDMIQKLKIELSELKKLMESLNSETLKAQMIPYIREFYSKNLKSLMKEEENENFKMRKELDNLEREKARLQRDVEWAEKKIKKDEKFVGVYIYRHTMKPGSIKK